MAIEHFTKLLQ
jgi:hypothetical protein